MNKRKLAIQVLMLVVAMATVYGCAKSRPYEELPKDKVFSKALVDTAAEYIYVPSVLDSTRFSSASRPYWLGEGKLVKLRFTENSLDVLEIDTDERFAKNETNARAVFSIPVEHVEFRCKENSVGECSNAEEEDAKLAWEKRSNFRAKLGDIQIQETNTLPIQIENLFNGDCYREVGSRLISAVVEKDAINLQVERSFASGLRCASEVESLSDLNFSTIHHYSLARLDTLASPDYQPVLYPEADQRTFGFFTSDTKRLSVDNRDRVADLKTWMNRWNPNRKELVYYLSDAFAKPEHSMIRAATFQAAHAVNDALAKAGAGFRVILKDGEGRSAGDVRNSMIVMVEDPPALGLLGYGPSTANPRTGEILSARVVMYPGIMKQTIRTTYEEIRTRRQERLELEKSGGVSPKAALVRSAVDKLANSSLMPRPDQAVLRGLPAKGEEAAPTRAGDRSRQLMGPPAPLARKLRPHFRPELREIEAMVRDYRKNVALEPRLQDRLQSKTKHCIYMAEDFNFEDAVAKGVKALGDRDLKPWEDLSEAERSAVLDQLLPYVWVPTLVHEIGHTLGLRHNFQGSEDKANFHSEEIPYSSVMDYAARTLNELRTMGKYDIAALKFGYARKVETADGKEIPVPGTIAKFPPNVQLKDYGFCTDEHVDVNAGCKRFDEGTNFAEIARFQIKTYDERYRWRNNRAGARNFSVRNDLSYAQSIDDAFFHLRMYLEVYTKLSSRYRISEEEWQTIPFLKSLDEATRLAGRFFMRVLATPDIHCLLLQRDESKPLPQGVRPGLYPLWMISGEAISCFDVQVRLGVLNAGLDVAAQTGKSFQSRKSPDNENPYGDQIDVRGIWIDKLLAAKYLLTRSVGSSLLDEELSNFMDYRDMGVDIRALLKGLIYNQLEGEVTLHDEKGESINAKIAYSFEPSSSLQIRESATLRALGKALGLPAADTTLTREVVALLGREIPHILNSGASSVLDPFTVHAVDINQARVKNGVPIGNLVYYGLPENELAAEVVGDLHALNVIAGAPPEEIEKLLAKMKAAKPEDEVPAEEKALRALGTEKLEKYVAGGYLDAETYVDILTKVLLRGK